MKMVLKDGKRKVLTLSYDDGCVQDERFIKILDKNKIKCTFNISTALYSTYAFDNGHKKLDCDTAIKLYHNSGHEVAVHTLTHPFLDKLDSTEVIYEITEDRKNIEREYGTIARGMAYPYGSYNDSVIDILKTCGISYARTAGSSYHFGFPENWLRLTPTCHHNDEKLKFLIQKFVEDNNEWNNAEMFYLWGHSYEFDDDDNWKLIEEFCEYVSNRDNIWYATNIEIYDYVQAYKRLYTSYDKRIIHNPSGVDVWFEIREKAYCIKAGEMIVID